MADEIFVPQELPSDNHAVVVVLESAQMSMPEIDTSPLTHETIVYTQTAKDDVAARIQNASVVLTTTSPVTAEAIEGAPNLKAVISYSAGVDHIDIATCKKRGIKVFNSPGCAAETVAGHAVAMYFALRRSLIPLNMAMRDFDESRPNAWKTGSLASLMVDVDHNAPKTCGEEVVGIIGYGKIGQHAATLCQGLGMQVLIAGRKGAESSAANTPFRVVLSAATILILALPLTPESVNLISTAELAQMRPDAVIINISRGSIVNEAALLAALVERRVFGYGTDVFEKEPAASGADSVLLGEDARGLNLVLTPHVAWKSDLTTENVTKMIQANIKRWAEGAPGTVV